MTNIIASSFHVEILHKVCWLRAHKKVGRLVKSKTDYENRHWFVRAVLQVKIFILAHKVAWRHLPPEQDPYLLRQALGNPGPIDAGSFTWRQIAPALLR